MATITMTSAQIQKTIDALTSNQTINATNREVSAALTAAHKSPIKVVNLLNSTQYRDIPEVKAARQLLGASRWSLDMLQATTDPETGHRVSVKTGKAIKTADELEAFASEEGNRVTFIDGKAFQAVAFEEFTMIAFIREALQVLKKRTAIKRAELTAELKEAKKTEKAAQKEAAKAQKAADRKQKRAQKKAEKKTEGQRDMLTELLNAGILTPEQYDAQLAKLTQEAA